MTIEKKAIEQCFSVITLILVHVCVLYKLSGSVCTFESVDERFP